MKEQLISIIVPVYNGETFLDRLVKSIMAQTYLNWELLLMEDASTDRTPAICDIWQQKDARIRVFHEEKNQGVSRERNRGIREARGEYLLFVDADDWILPDCLTNLYQDIQRPGVEIAGCAFRSCTDADWETMQRKLRSGRDGLQSQGMRSNLHGTQKNTSGEDGSPVLITGKDFLKEGILKRDTRCWSKLYRRSLVEGHYFREDYTIGEDMLFLWEVSKGAELISCSTYPGYCYYHNINGAMLKPFRKADMDQIRCWQFLLTALQEENYDNDVISATASILLISCMLVAGKLALLPGRVRKEYAAMQRRCSKVLRKTMRIPGAFEKLDRGYRLKVRIYGKAPGLYLALYHMGKKVIKL